MVDIIIVNWNAGILLKKCLESIIQYGQEVNKIIIVDNGSSDGSHKYAQDINEVILIEAGENLGFGRACNLGAKQSESEYLLFLNPDAQLLENSLKKPLEFLEKQENSQVGICGIQLLDDDAMVAQSCARFPTLFLYCVRSFGLDKLFPHWSVHLREWDHSTSKTVDHVMGAFFLVRKSVFESLNGFDERFFVYLEDLDFSYRVKENGWESYYLADAQAKHIGGGVSEQVKAKRLFYSLRSRLLYIEKHFNRLSILLLFLLTLLIEPITRTVKGILNFSSSTVTETWKGYIMLYKWIIRSF